MTSAFQVGIGSGFRWRCVPAAAGLVSVLAEEVLPVGAAEEEAEAVQVSAERVQAVGGRAEVGQERWGERGGAGGGPSAGELQESVTPMAISSASSPLTPAAIGKFAR